jgi:N-acetylglutamate synthase
MTDTTIAVSPMTIGDYDAVVALWQATEGIGFDERSDSREGIVSYLGRNPGFSHVARAEGRIVGAVLCGHDGRRGYLHHLAVASQWRRKGIGRQLVDACLAKLTSLDIPKCNIFLFAHNELGAIFWKQIGWNGRPDLKVLQRTTTAEML